MGLGNGSGTSRHTWLVGRIAVLLAVVVVGSLAIVRYSSLGNMLAASPGPSAVAAHASIEAATATAAPAGSPSSNPGQAGAASGATAGGASSGRAHSGHASSGSLASSPASGSAGSGAAAAASPAASRPASPSSARRAPGAKLAAPPLHFRTLPPGAKLPTGAQCARWVRETPLRENKAANKKANQTVGQHVGAHFFSAGDSPKADKLLAPRINGYFTGTTKEILRWASCKWGINQYTVFAQAAVESWWQQSTLGDWDSDASACPPGHKLGADGTPGQCPQSYGILQNRYPFEKASWPGIGRSTAMNADTAYAIWRSCYDGYEGWLNTVPEPQAYHKGDLWGCVGRWFSGRWHTAPAQQYIAKVKKYQSERIWLTKDFQQG
jgi:hypothetical protein